MSALPLTPDVEGTLGERLDMTRSGLARTRRVEIGLTRGYLPLIFFKASSATNFNFLSSSSS